MKGKGLLRATALLSSAALPLALLAGASANASASGTEFHVVETLSCNDPTFCGTLDLIDFHGEAQFNADGSGSGQLTLGAIVLGSGPAAAQDFAIDIADLNGQPGWYVGQNGDLFITNETDTFTGHGGPPVTVSDAFPPYPHDLGIPAALGHYDTTGLFGFTPPPGVTFEIQVTEIPK
jgi:hypothetical protein